MFPIMSGSMMPFLCPGGRVIVECVPADKCHLGDIIVFQDPGRLIAHRVLLRLRLGKRIYLYQKGDSAGVGYWVSGDKLIGVVTRSIDADGTQLYLRDRNHSGTSRRIYGHLWCDFMARARSAVKAMAARTGLRRNHG